MNAQEQFEEYEKILESTHFKRAQTISKLFSYICLNYFQGKTENINEYTIGVEALGRKQDFDPQSDPIVRVSVHSLRKRLLAYYQNEGAASPLRITLPTGSYVPVFETVAALEKLTDETARIHEVPPVQAETALGEETLTDATPQESEAPRQAVPGRKKPRWILPSIAVLLLMILGAAGYWISQHRSTPPAPPRLVVAPPGSTVRFRVGGVAPYTDSDQDVWYGDNYCKGGTSFERSTRQILGTRDPSLYYVGRQGIIHCRIPVPAGTYELHFLLAETEDSGVAAHRASFMLNDSQEFSFDVVDEAQAPDRAVMEIVNDAVPEKDGFIHLDTNSDRSYLNSIEVLPGVSGSTLPLQIVTSITGVTDSHGSHWLSDRYFTGGSSNHHAFNAKGTADPMLYQWDRFGHSRYNLPALPNREYTVTLYFSESYYGPQKWINSGSGSRIFDVLCNGQRILSNFDIQAESKPDNEAVVKQFRHIKANGRGRIEIEFESLKDYPTVNAIQIQAE